MNRQKSIIRIFWWINFKTLIVLNMCPRKFNVRFADLFPTILRFSMLFCVINLIFKSFEPLVQNLLKKYLQKKLFFQIIFDNFKISTQTEKYKYIFLKLFKALILFKFLLTQATQKPLTRVSWPESSSRSMKGKTHFQPLSIRT